MKKRASISTMEGPPGVSSDTDRNNPSATEREPKIAANKAICSGVSDSGRRVKRYTITEQGRAQLRAESNRWNRFSTAVTRALGART